MDLTPRLRAVCDLSVPEVREFSGRHEYDGRMGDLSPTGVRTALARLADAAASGERRDDPHDEAQLAAFIEHLIVVVGENISFDNLFATHPSTENRITALRELGRELGARGAESPVRASHAAPGPWNRSSASRGPWE